MSIEETSQMLPAGWRWAKLGELCDQDRQTIDPSSDRAKHLPYLSLEHIAVQTGRISRDPLEKVEDEGKSTTFLFDSRHVLYGKLRPYLNKVALPEFEGRCTTEAIPLLPREETSRLFLAWLLRREETIAAAMAEKTGSRMPRANMDDLLKLVVPLPPFPEQKRIAATLTEKMTAVEKARTAAEARLKAAKELPAAYLREVFESEEAQVWPRKRIEEIAELLPSKSIASDGDTEVKAITTACLSEVGFLTTGIKTARMKSRDVPQCVVAPGELLIARSNTPDLVGRVAMFEGEPSGVVASDLTIRIMPDGRNNSEFLASYLSFLYLSGYWKERAGGASGSMKKITRGQILAEKVPVPPSVEQQRIMKRLKEKTSGASKLTQHLQDELTSTKELPSALLRQAFAGEL